jgi:hypothetical protein
LFVVRMIAVTSALGLDENVFTSTYQQHLHADSAPDATSLERCVLEQSVGPDSSH